MADQKKTQTGGGLPYAFGSCLKQKNNTGLLVASESESSNFRRREAIALALALSTASGSANAAGKQCWVGLQLLALNV